MIGSNNVYTSPGGAFAPQIIERFVTVTGNTLKLYYNVSTWNPYVIVRMRSQFTIAGCQYSLSQGGQAFPAQGGTGTIDITAAPGCAWTVANVPSWVTITGTIVSPGSRHGHVSSKSKSWCRSLSIPSWSRDRTSR